MPKLFIAMENQMLILEDAKDKWIAKTKLQRTSPECVASDTFNPDRLYVATFRQGLWISDESGETWRRAGKGIGNDQVTSVAVSSKDRRNGFGIVYAGTEPSSFFRSDDGGETWKQPAALTDLPSSSSWSFPPRPDTHHVRYISADPTRSGVIYLAIEAGALIRSFDGGITWKDRVKGGPYDTHIMTTSAQASGRLYSAAGDGYFESHDYGESWEANIRGLKQHYLYCVSVHPSDPDTVLVSASPGPWTAYNPENPESYVYRKTAGDDWKQVSLGKNSERSTVSVFAPNPQVEGEFYAVNSLGVHRTSDAGLTWEKLAIAWLESYRQNVRSVALIGN